MIKNTTNSNVWTKQKLTQRKQISDDNNVSVCSSRTTKQAHDIFPTILFVAVWDGRDGENLPSGYKAVFFAWDGMDGWMDGGTSTNFALTYVLDTKFQSDFSQFCSFRVISHNSVIFRGEFQHFS